VAARARSSVNAAERTIVITRVINAPRELVFEAWTKAEHLSRWFGARDFSAPEVTADVCVGGAWRACIRSPEGRDYWMHGVYREIVPPERLVFTHVWEEGHDSPRHETLVSVTLEDQGGKTKLTFHKAVLESVAERISQGTGWSECLDRLAQLLATMS
jgi:uncharacterized protein YndB with AHSA1/START domain